jgi:hypothetical protein
MVQMNRMDRMHRCTGRMMTRDVEMSSSNSYVSADGGGDRVGTIVTHNIQFDNDDAMTSERMILVVS